MKNFFNRLWNKIKEIWLICANFITKTASRIGCYIKEFCLKGSRHPFYFIIMISSFILGFVLLFIPSRIIVDYAYLVLGLTLIVLGFSKIAKYRNERLINYYEGTLNIVVGVFVIASHQVFTMILVALFLIALPIYRIIRSTNKEIAFKNELMYFVLAFIILFCGNFFAGLFIKVTALLLILVSGYFGYILWSSKENYFSTNTRVIRKEVIDIKEVDSDSTEETNDEK